MISKNRRSRPDRMAFSSSSRRALMACSSGVVGSSALMASGLGSSLVSCKFMGVPSFPLD